MDSSIIGKIEKARQYAEEKYRVNITNFSATFQGNHNNYEVHYESGNWRCECHFFARRATCSHTMAMERVLAEMLPKEHKQEPQPV